MLKEQETRHKIDMELENLELIRNKIFSRMSYVAD